MLTEGPHRSSTFVERCSDCDRAAIDVCFRCNRPWCKEHSSFDEDLCRECDLLWLERKQKIEAAAEVSPLIEVGVATMTPAAFIGLAIVAGFGMLLAGLAAAVGFMIGLPLGGAVARAVNRPIRQRAMRQLRRERERFLGDGELALCESSGDS